LILAAALNRGVEGRPPDEKKPSAAEVLEALRQLVQDARPAFPGTPFHKALSHAQQILERSQG
jgi:alkanesulfonate monooxygenase SsuD/methylene tetrahydromethanopterin reductase-like flavin-dependent oxidoreductase (luciferase family)